MPHDVISTCPVCSGELAVTRLHCRSCGTTLEGEFSVGRFGRLTREQLVLLESFLRSRGNLRDMERELGISYPTVRSRVEALIRALGFGPRDGDEAADDAARPTRWAPPRSGSRSSSASPGARSAPTRPPPPSEPLGAQTDDQDRPRGPARPSSTRSARAAGSSSASPPARSPFAASRAIPPASGRWTSGPSRTCSRSRPAMTTSSSARSRRSAWASSAAATARSWTSRSPTARTSRSTPPAPTSRPAT